MSPLNITQPLGSIRYIRSIMATIFGDVQYTQNGTVTIPSGIPSVTVCSPKKKVSWMRITSCQSMNSICQLPISPIWRIPIKGYQLTYQTAEHLAELACSSHNFLHLGIYIYIYMISDICIISCLTWFLQLFLCHRYRQNMPKQYHHLSPTSTPSTAPRRWLSAPPGRLGSMPGRQCSPPGRCCAACDSPMFRLSQQVLKTCLFCFWKIKRQGNKSGLWDRLDWIWFIYIYIYPRFGSFRWVW